MYLPATSVENAASHDLVIDRGAAAEKLMWSLVWPRATLRRRPSFPPFIAFGCTHLDMPRPVSLPGGTLLLSARFILWPQRLGVRHRLSGSSAAFCRSSEVLAEG
jgi:hypothetical protein